MTGGCSRLRRLFVALLVISVVTQPMVGSAAAAPGDPCDDGDTADLIVDFFTTGVQAGENIVDGGSWLENDGGLIADEECIHPDQLAEQTKVRVYEAALYSADMQGHVQAMQANHIDDSRTYVATIAKREILVGIENGDNLSTIEQNVNESIDAYYETLQINTLNAWTSSLNDLYYLGNISEYYGAPANLQVANFYNDDEQTRASLNPNTTPSYSQWDSTELVISTRNVTLLNGTTHNYTRLVWEDPDTVGSEYDQEVLDLVNNTYEGTNYEYGAQVWARHPSSDEGPGSQVLENATVVLDEDDWRELWLSIEDASTQMKRNYAGPNGVAEQAMDALNASEFDATEFVDANTLATQFSTNYNTTGYYGWRAAETALLGWNGTLNDSFSITYDPYGTDVSWSNESGNITRTETELGPRNMSGVLYTNWAPNSTNGSFVSGVTYDTNNATSPVFFINQTTSDESNVVTLNGTFTINSLTNVRTGETVNSTTLVDQNRQTSDVNLTVEQMRQLLDLEKDAVESYDGAGGGGGGGGFNFGGLSLGGAAIGGLVALGIVLVVLGNGNPLSGS